MFSSFSFVASVYSLCLWRELPGSKLLGALTLLFGVAGIISSACIYLVRARPSWNTKHTIADFFLTAMLLGPLFAASAVHVENRALLGVAVAAASAHVLNQAARFFRLTASETFERTASAQLLSTTLASRLMLRGALLLLGGIVLPLLVPTPGGAAAALILTLSGEILGRYLFFVSVVPKNMAASYLSAGQVAG